MLNMRLRNLLIVFGTVLTLATPPGAAPMVPERPRLTAEQRTLRDLSEVKLDVFPLAEDLTEAGMTHEGLRKAFTKTAESAGLKIVDADDVPMARLVIFASKNPQQPDALALTFILAIHQRIAVKRLNEDFKAPTAFFTQTRLTTLEDAERLVEWELRTMTRRVMKIVNRASE
ncbi:MAG: hypothetical protein CMJ18_02270 [Phycisphaeraceae bacterium]|nr:hypothetical protein [Phycisphaeraceae bacterium]